MKLGWCASGRCVISLVQRNLGSDEGHFSKLGWCASDMTLCHITCAPEPGFGPGSILFLLKGVGSQDYGVQVICRCVISLARPYGHANVQAYGVLK